MTNPFKLYETITFLKADLVWSDDFDAIRDSLANLLQAMSQNFTVKEIEKLEPALTQFIADLTESESWES
jgi:hypothetical protein